MKDTSFESVSDNELLSLAQRAYRRTRASNAELVRILIAVHERRLHLKKAFPSLFEFCVKRLGTSNSSAHRFSVAARLCAQFPGLVERIERNEIHLSTLVQMRHYLTHENAEELLELSRGKTRQQVEELLASVAPRPDARSRMRKLPSPRSGQSVDAVQHAVEPLAPERYRVQFMADRETRDDILGTRDLMRHSNPSGDLEVVMKFCARAGRERLEARQRGLIRQRLGRRPQDRPPRPSSRNVPRAVRRAVFERDGARCTFHDDEGHRCSALTLLELDHVNPHALGGLNTVANLRVRCRSHNLHDAENVFGKAFIEQRITARKQKSKREGQQTASVVKDGAMQTPKSKAMPVLAVRGLKKAKEPRVREASGSLTRGDSSLAR